MKKILYVGDGVTLAHVVRPLELAERKLGESGSQKNVCDSRENETDSHESAAGEIQVHFACDEKYKSLLVVSDIVYHPIHTMDREIFLNRLASGQPVFDYTYLAQCMAEDETLIEEICPDEIYMDFRFTMYLCAKKHGVRCATITNAYWSAFSLIDRPVFGMNVVSGQSFSNSLMAKKGYARYVSRFLRDLNFLRVEQGMEEVSSIEEMYCAGDVTLFADFPELAPVSVLALTESYIGPLTGKIKAFQTPETEDALRRIKKIKENPKARFVYFSLGSSGDYGKIQDYLSAFGEINAYFFVTVAHYEKTDKIINAEKHEENVFCYHNLNVDAIMPYMDLAITNGGSGANYQAYENHVKIIAMPDNVDQMLASSKLEEVGAGIVLDKNQRANGKLLGEKIRTLLQLSCEKQ